LHKIYKANQYRKFTILTLAALLTSFALPSYASTASNRATFKKVEPLLLTKTDVEILQGLTPTVDSSKTGYLTEAEQITKLKSDVTKLDPKLKKKFLAITTKALSDTAQCAKKASATTLGEATGNSFLVVKDSGSTTQTISSSLTVLKGDASKLVRNKVSQKCILPIAVKMSNDMMGLLDIKITLEVEKVTTIPSSSLPKSCTGYSMKSNIPETDDTLNIKSTSITITCSKANLAPTYSFDVISTSGTYIEITPEEESQFIDIVKRTQSKIT
jgi:hypothetical protein